MSYLSVFLGLYGLFLLSSVTSLLRNYLKARRTGLPIVINPFNQINLLWMIFAPMFQKTAARLLPLSIYRLIRPGIIGYDFVEGWNLYKDLGSSTYVYVTSSTVDVQCANPEFLEQVWGWRTGFCLDPIGKKLLGVQGPNLMSVEGRDWQRQRRIIAPLLNEKISGVVWAESLQQSSQMMNWAEANNQLTTNTVVDGLKTIAINVLGAAGYGFSQSWTPPNHNASAQSTSQSFYDSISLQTQFFILTALVPTTILRLPFMPKRIRNLAAAKLNFPRYAQDLIETERVSQASKSTVRSNIMAMLLKALDHGDDIAEEKSRVQKQIAMSADEVQGNLFILSIAGFETTANTMAYAVVCLAVYPEWQEWLIEEIDFVASQDPAELYEKTYPKLLRCLAFMFEVLRIYTPVGHTARTLTSNHVVKLPSSGNTYNLPAGMIFAFANQGVHLNPAIYGPSAEKFDPARWMSADTSSTSEMGEKSLRQPAKATFLAWSFGPRACPGMKMSQVEFVAVIFGILKRYTVSPAICHEGQTLKDAREKLKERMTDSRQKITLTMNRPQDVWLSWKKR